MNRIFISIASYRDSDLNPTVRDCLSKAKDPSRLRFGIAWQRDESETLDFINDSRFRVLDIPYRESNGACWARSRIQERLYDGEEYYFQLDSHHRFIQNWDEKLLEYLAMCPSKKPILTAYVPSFDPAKFTNVESLNHTPWKIDYWRFVEQGIIIYRPSSIPNYNALKTPVPARFLSGHTLFASGEFVEEVPYDENLYFTGEEMTLAVRAFTHGWDLYHPHRVVNWHEYERKYRTKHWDDHASKNSRNWFEIDRISKMRCGDLLLRNVDLGKHGLGKVRTLRDYERYAGVCFALRGVEPHTAKHLPPPSPLLHLTDEEWKRSFLKSYSVTATFDRNKLDLSEGDEYEFWYFGCHDSDGNELIRLDLSKREVGKILKQESDKISVTKTFDAPANPISWTIWPYTKNKQWQNKITSKI